MYRQGGALLRLPIGQIAEHRVEVGIPIGPGARVILPYHGAVPKGVVPAAHLHNIVLPAAQLPVPIVEHGVELVGLSHHLHHQLRPAVPVQIQQHILQLLRRGQGDLVQLQPLRRAIQRPRLPCQQGPVGRQGLGRHRRGGQRRRNGHGVGGFFQSFQRGGRGAAGRCRRLSASRAGGKGNGQQTGQPRYGRAVHSGIPPSGGYAVMIPPPQPERKPLRGFKW